jgi:hypothetical protein
MAIHPSIRRLRFAVWRLEVGDSSIPQTLPREDPDFDFRYRFDSTKNRP